jgi:nucleoside-diphosphate-sugar epimerase
MKRAAVWGASGFVGSRLTRELASRDWQVCALLRSGESGTLPSEIAIRPLSFESDAAQFDRALDGVEVAFHCAGSPAATPQAMADYVEATRRFAEAACRAGARLVHLSTVAVYGAGGLDRVGRDAPLCGAGVYAQSRRAAEEASRACFAAAPEKLLIVRVPMVVGKDMRSQALRRFFSVLRWGVFPHPGAPDAVLNCIGIARLGQRLVEVADTGHGVRLWSDSIRWTDLAQAYGRAAGVRIRRLPLPQTLINALLDGLVPTRAADLKVLSNRVHFIDDGNPVAAGLPEPATLDDVDELIASLGVAPRKIAQ